MTKSIAPRSHTELAHRMIELHIDNAADELHDRDRDDAYDALAPHIDSIRALARFIHDDTYAHMTTRYDDTIPMTDDDAIELANELPDACDDAECCQRAYDLLTLTLYTHHAAYDLPIAPTS